MSSAAELEQRKQAFEALKLYIQKSYFDGMPSGDLGGFYRQYPQHKEALSSGNWRTYAKDYGISVNAEVPFKGNYILKVVDAPPEQRFKLRYTIMQRGANGGPGQTMFTSQAEDPKAPGSNGQRLPDPTNQLAGGSSDTSPQSINASNGVQQRGPGESSSLPNNKNHSIKSAQPAFRTNGYSQKVNGFATPASTSASDIIALHPESRTTLAEVPQPSVPKTTEDKLESFFRYKTETRNPSETTTFNLVNNIMQPGMCISEFGLLGTVCDDVTAGQPPLPSLESLTEEQRMDRRVFLNTSSPFCIVATGVQGVGKSRTVSTLVENCMIKMSPVVELDARKCTLLFHYEGSETSACEPAALVEPDETLLKFMSDEEIPDRGSMAESLRVKELVVVTSPSYFAQRSKYYEGWKNTKVVPLLFRWAQLTSWQIRSLMQLGEGDTQLFVSVMMEIFRRYQMNDSKPSFRSFLDDIASSFTNHSHLAPLRQRLELLKSLVVENYSSADQARGYGPFDLTEIMQPGVLIVVDLTDPILSPDEANGIFNVLLEIFRNAPAKGNCGKLCVLNEAHKYLVNSKLSLSRTLVSTVRDMAHYRIGIIVSTESPKAIPAELFELLSVCIIHSFHSQEWFDYLAQKLSLSNHVFEKIMHLEIGHAMVFSTRSKVDFRVRESRNKLHPLGSLRSEPRKSDAPKTWDFPNLACNPPIPNGGYPHGPPPAFHPVSEALLSVPLELQGLWEEICKDDPPDFEWPTALRPKHSVLHVQVRKRITDERMTSRVFNAQKAGGKA